VDLSGDGGPSLLSKQQAAFHKPLRLTARRSRWSAIPSTARPGFIDSPPVRMRPQVPSGARSRH
jgi:hypothetical protein